MAFEFFEVGETFSDVLIIMRIYTWSSGRLERLVSRLIIFYFSGIMERDKGVFIFLRAGTFSIFLIVVRVTFDFCIGGLVIR